ncbi:hypothetical protein GCM10010451_66220 [Streptomyces virens]|uniref:Uncharacterized protein n=3 Tax=Bacillati TaxID=1783272 RepID=A0ABN3UYP9_9ACTN
MTERDSEDVDTDVPTTEEDSQTDTFVGIETDNPTESGIYVYNHATETPEASGFESREQAETWVFEESIEAHLEVVDSRPLGDDPGLEETMTRTGAVEPHSVASFEDHVADYAHDAIDAGLEPVDVVEALRTVEDEIVADLEEPYHRRHGLTMDQAAEALREHIDDLADDPGETDYLEGRRPDGTEKGDLEATEFVDEEPTTPLTAQTTEGDR